MRLLRFGPESSRSPRGPHDGASRDWPPPRMQLPPKGGVSNDGADQEVPPWHLPSRAIATLVFQVAVRTRECTGASNCALSYGKAVVWSVIWPASWAAYLEGRFCPDAPFSRALRDRLLPKGAA